MKEGKKRKERKRSGSNSNSRKFTSLWIARPA
jgi:hypothetical protein